jgi:hypothetical protein
VNVGDALQAFWQTILDVMSKIVIPDWTSLVNLLPVFLVIGVLGPLLSLALLVWVIYFLMRPRAPLPAAPEPYQAPLDESERPIFPRGEPFCYRDGLVYPTSTTRCEVCRDELSIRCPKCDVTRSASISTCGNCGLELKFHPQALVVHRYQPPPGGSAAA